MPVQPLLISADQQPEPLVKGSPRSKQHLNFMVGKLLFWHGFGDVFDSWTQAHPKGLIQIQKRNSILSPSAKNKRGNHIIDSPFGKKNPGDCSGRLFREVGYFLAARSINQGNQVQVTLRCLPPVLKMPQFSKGIFWTCWDICHFFFLIFWITIFNNSFWAPSSRYIPVGISESKNHGNTGASHLKVPSTCIKNAPTFQEHFLDLLGHLSFFLSNPLIYNF